MFEIIPETQIRQEDYERKDGMLRKKLKNQNLTQVVDKTNAKNVHREGKPNVLEVPKEFPNQITQ